MENQQPTINIVKGMENQQPTINIQVAAAKGDTEALSSILIKGNVNKVLLGLALRKAIEHEKQESVRVIIDSGQKIDTNQLGFSLQHASNKGNLEIVKKILMTEQKIKPTHVGVALQNAAIKEKNDIFWEILLSSQKKDSNVYNVIKGALESGENVLNAVKIFAKKEERRQLRFMYCADCYDHLFRNYCAECGAPL
jgi:hypothetical protein